MWGPINVDPRQKNIDVDLHIMGLTDMVVPHVSPFRHKYFWDCGVHCVTNDLNRIGQKQLHVNHNQ